MSAFGGDHRMQYSPFVHPVTANGVRCVVVDARLEQVEPMAYRFLLNFAKDNELQVRDGRVAERTKLAEMQRVGDTRLATDVCYFIPFSACASRLL